MTHAHAPEARKTSLAPQVLTFVVLAVAIGVGALTGVRGFSRTFRHMLLRQARTLMAGDLTARIFVRAAGSVFAGTRSSAVCRSSTNPGNPRWSLKRCRRFSSSAARTGSVSRSSSENAAVVRARPRWSSPASLAASAGRL